MSTLSTFAIRFKELRESAGLKQSEICEKLGVSRGTISFYENCDRTPDIEFAAKAAKLFHVTTDYLLGLTDYKTAKAANLKAEDLGLTENAAAILAAQNQDANHSNLIVLNYLIESQSFLDHVTAYFASAFKSMAQERPFTLIPYDRHKIDSASRLPFADIIELFPKYKDDFYNDTTASTEYLIEQMTFAFIKGCSNDDMAVELCDLLRNSQNSDTDDQLETIAKFLIYFGYSDFANRSDCHLERFLERMDDENGKPQDNN